MYKIKPTHLIHLQWTENYNFTHLNENINIFYHTTLKATIVPILHALNIYIKMFRMSECTKFAKCTAFMIHNNC